MQWFYLLNAIGIMLMYTPWTHTLTAFLQTAFSTIALLYYTRFSWFCQLKYLAIVIRPHKSNTPTWNRTSFITHTSSFSSTLFTIYFTIHLQLLLQVLHYYLHPFETVIIRCFKASRTNVRRVMGPYDRLWLTWWRTTGNAKF